MDYTNAPCNSRALISFACCPQCDKNIKYMYLFSHKIWHFKTATSNCYHMLQIHFSNILCKVQRPKIYHWHYSIYLNQKCNSFFNIWSAIFTNQFFCCLRNWLEKILSRIIFYSLFHIFILPWTLMLWNEKIYKCSFFQRWISTKKCRALICKRSQATG